MNHLQSSIEEEEKNRSGYLRLAREAVRKRREKVALQVPVAYQDPNKIEVSEDVEIIKKCLQSSGDEIELYLKLQKLIEKNSADVAAEVESIEQDSHRMMNRIAGYNQFMKGQESVGNRMELCEMNQ